MMRSVFVAVLSYTGKPHPKTEEAIARSVEMMRERGWPVVYKLRLGDSILPRARNAMLSEFIDSPCTDMVCIDDDVSWDGDELVRLLDHEVDIVAGAYPAKADKPNYFVLWDTSKPEIRSVDAPRNWLIEVEGVPTGFLRISRRAAVRMQLAYANRFYADEGVPGGRSCCLFNFELWDNRFWGEDLAFCKRWRDIGGRIYLDPMISLNHHGKPSDEHPEGLTYVGNVGQWMRETFNNERKAA